MVDPPPGIPREDLPELETREIQPVAMFIRIRRFEERFRQFLYTRMKEAYGNGLENRLKGLIGRRDLKEIRARNLAQQRRYGQRPDDTIELAKIFEQLGFEHYRNIIGNNGAWKTCFQDFFTSREEVVSGLIRISDARNEIYHNRGTIHPDLWQTCRLEIDSIVGQITMDREHFQKMVDRVLQDDDDQTPAPAPGA